MKSLFFALLVSLGYISMHAQSVPAPQQALTDNTWYLTKIVKDGQEMGFAPSSEVEEATVYTTLSSENELFFWADFCTGGGGEITMLNDTIFTLDSFVVLANTCMHQSNQTYQEAYFSILWYNIHDPFVYAIAKENAELLVLTITAEDGNQMYYQNAPLSVKTVQETTVKLYPNPVQDKLYFTNLTQPTQITVFTLTGERVFTQYINEGKSQVSVANLPSGIYVYKLTRKHKSFHTGKLVKQ